MSKYIETPAGYELNPEDYYENRSVNKGRSDKSCAYCGSEIPKGQKHTMHHFYPEFNAYPTHDMHPKHGDNLGEGEESCTQKFKKLLGLPSYY